MKRVLVLKIHTDLRGEELKKRAMGDWKINPKNLLDVDYVVVMNRKLVIAEYTLGNSFSVFRNTRRVELSLIDNTPKLELLNKKFAYNTVNPATIILLSALKKREIESNDDN